MFNEEYAKHTKEGICMINDSPCEVNENTALSAALAELQGKIPDSGEEQLHEISETTIKDDPSLQPK